ncbi:hypothetical protein D030_4906B, partial [Vibrio parahaemolyticus AQ3810]
PLQKQASGRDS